MKASYRANAGKEIVRASLGSRFALGVDVMRFALIFTLISTSLVFAPCAFAASDSESEPHRNVVEITTSPFFPTKDDRPLRSVFFDAAVGRDLAPVPVWLLFGVTATSAFGSITQDTDSGRVTLASSAFGFGPSFGVRFDPLRIGPLSVGGDASGALVLYDKRFPAGGDYYDFAWRVGFSAAVRIDDRIRIIAGVRWMHVSNGQGIGPWNPSYEGFGIPVGVSFAFDGPHERRK
jgi:hypothetical protein